MRTHSVQKYLRDILSGRGVRLRAKQDLPQHLVVTQTQKAIGQRSHLRVPECPLPLPCQYILLDEFLHWFDLSLTKLLRKFVLLQGAEEHQAEQSLFLNVRVQD